MFGNNKEVIVKTQKELDKISVTKDVYIKIEGGTYYDRIIVNKNYCNPVEAREVEHGLVNVHA